MSKKKRRDPETTEVRAEDLADDGGKRLLFGFAAVLFAAGFVVAVIAVLFRPERIVLVGTDPHETAWFTRALKPIAGKANANLKVVAYRDLARFDSLMAADRAHGKKIVLAEVPPERLAALAESGQVAALRTLGGGDALLAAYTPEAAQPAQVGGRAYYVPSRMTTLCLAYSKARVADAVAHADEVRSLVDGWLRAANGTGLPANFRLESDPAEWDSYDLLMVAAYWANQPFIDGTAPRVGHVTAPASALSFDLAARAFSMGAVPEEVLALDGYGVRDALAWESLWFEHGLYDTNMVAKHWTPADVASEVAAGRVWLATLEPSVILRIHGLAADSMQVGGRAAAPVADVGLSRLPRGVSLELRNKFPERSGDPWSVRAVYGWAAPSTCPDKGLALKLMNAFSDPEYQVDAARTLGWLPIRKDLLDGVANVFAQKDEFELAYKATRQAYGFGRPLPNTSRWPLASTAFARAWEEACVARRSTAPIELAETLRQSLGAAR